MGIVGAPSLADGVNVFAGRMRTETITSSGTNAAGALVAQAGDVAQVYCETAVIANAGAAATASVGVYVPPSYPIYISLSSGQSINVIDA